ncbi:MAG TPA: CopD family protein [Rhodanobacteraceae bacterium]
MLSMALSAFDIASLLAVVGVLVCRVAVVQDNAPHELHRKVRQTTAALLALLTLASFGILLSRTLELNGGAWATLLADIGLALHVTHFGHVWLWRLPALAIAWLAWTRLRRAQSGHAAWLMLLAVAAIALTRSETGHPADHGDFTLAVWIDWLHMLAAGAWVGTLFTMSLAVFPALQRAHDAERNLAVFQRLSTLSGWALGVLLAAGIYNTWAQLGGVASLWTSRYGAALDVKLAIVLLMILIGAHNRYVKLPRLRAAGHDTAAALRSCARAVLIESLLGLAVMGATGVLLHQMPPADMPAAMQPMTAYATMR